MVAGWRRAEEKARSSVGEWRRDKEKQESLYVLGLPLECLREVRQVIPRVRFTPPRACLLAFLLACIDVRGSLGRRPPGE